LSIFKVGKRSPSLLRHLLFDRLAVVDLPIMVL
jgi:hypothetical protein